MLQKILIHGLPFLLPFAAYLLYLKFSRRGGEWTRTAWFWLTAIGLVLSILSLIALRLVGEDSIEGEYVPPRVEDGRIVPGHVIPPKPQ
ncbi:DUF6111 family protein [Oceanibacterium hippocampi]|uniref:Uncharacterized protein n=1 Tax=Oceanibacterium hippocampi TaxID=745714 RepID=A0A1Y5SAG8_9PROT|nr:DUF6111 family protein [Oceanibacterium hippocampi]SLN34644.1 hypothetical protein OCH7691_01355 [Oceanibacterium hippocampi]